jgi:hypothetical protein
MSTRFFEILYEVYIDKIRKLTNYLKKFENFVQMYILFP